MGWLKKTAAAVGSAIGKTVLYATAAATAFVGALTATPYLDEGIDVIDMATHSGEILISEDTSSRSGELIVSGDTGFRSGELSFIPSRDDPTLQRSGWVEYVPSRDDPVEDTDPVVIPNAFDTFGGDQWFDQSFFDTVSHADPVGNEVSYVGAVPERHVIAEHSRFFRVVEDLDPSDLRVAIPPREYTPSDFRNLPFYRYTYFVWLESGAIPSNAIPSNYTSLNRNLRAYTPDHLFDTAFREAIPSNYWGMIYAIPSNLTHSELVNIYGADADLLPAAIPSNLTVEHLRSYGIPVESPAIPSNAIPSNAIPSNAIPSNAIPSNAIPSNAIPSNAIPSNAIPSNAIPSNLMPSRLSVLEQLNPEDVFKGDLLNEVMNQFSQQDFTMYRLTSDDSFQRDGRMAVDSLAAESEEYRDLISDLWYEEYGLEVVWSSSENRVYMACADSCETVALPYGTGREQAPDVGVETVSIGPRIGVETIEIGAMEYLCTEDLSHSYIWLGHLYNGDFAMRFTLGPSQNYQAETYELSIDNQLTADCIIDPENPQLLQCIRDGIASERWAEFVLRSQPASCEVFNESRYVCPAGETYHAPNPWWDGSYGLCCTTACWCTLPGGETGCFNNCPGCPP